jgi:hypothetical protein
MNGLTTLDFANTLMADAERRWLYGHPYRSAPRHSAYFGIRSDSRTPGRFAALRFRRGSGALGGRRTLAA